MKNKILVFGDSITYGQLDLEAGGWVNRLRLMIANDSSPVSCHVFNMGISGQVSGEVLARLDRECEGRALGDTNNIIVLAAGINDTQIIKGSVRIGESEFRENVRGLVSHARLHAQTVLYLGLTPVDERRTSPWRFEPDKSWQNRLIQRYDDIISELCGEEGVRYIHAYDLIDPLTNKDGLHPSAAGHALLADLMYREIRPLLR